MKHTKWILLAEDDSQIVELTALALDAETLGCEVIVANDGVEVFDCLYRRGRFRDRDGGLPAAILLDLKMPRLDGLQVLYHLKSDERLKSIPVVMLTSSREESDIARSYQLGANAFVVKPVDFGCFSRAIKLLGEFWVSLNEPSPDASFEAAAALLPTA